jgi:hypothetical protein
MLRGLGVCAARHARRREVRGELTADERAYQIGFSSTPLHMQTSPNEARRQA